ARSTLRAFVVYRFLIASLLSRSSHKPRECRAFHADYPIFFINCYRENSIMRHKQINNNSVNQIMLILIILLICIVFFTNLYYYLPVCLGAVTLYLLYRRYCFLLTE